MTDILLYFIPALVLFPFAILIGRLMIIDKPPRSALGNEDLEDNELLKKCFECNVKNNVFDNATCEKCKNFKQVIL